MIILTLGCSNKPAEKEIKMPMLFHTREQAEKEAYKFDGKGAHQMGNKWMPCSIHKHHHLNEYLISPIFINIELFFCRDLLYLLLKKFLREFILISVIPIKEVLVIF